MSKMGLLLEDDPSSGELRILHGLLGHLNLDPLRLTWGDLGKLYGVEAPTSYGPTARREWCKQVGIREAHAGTGQYRDAIEATYTPKEPGVLSIKSYNEARGDQYDILEEEVPLPRKVLQGMIERLSVLYREHEMKALQAKFWDDLYDKTVQSPQARFGVAPEPAPAPPEIASPPVVEPDDIQLYTVLNITFDGLVERESITTSNGQLFFQVRRSLSMKALQDAEDIFGRGSTFVTTDLNPYLEVRILNPSYHRLEATYEQMRREALGWGGGA